MVRDIENIVRNLEDTKNNDIIYKKMKILDMFKRDPDLDEVLNVSQPRPLNKFENDDFPTDEELAIRKEIVEYNEKISHDRIIPYLKLNGIQQEVLNFIMFDIKDDSVSSNNNSVKYQYLIVICLVHESDMETQYGIPRLDLMSYIVRDLLHYTNELGIHLELRTDSPEVLDSYYYARTMEFLMMEPNYNYKHYGMNNKYDKFK